MNPQLDDEAPADVIREGRLREALVAAQSFVSGGLTWFRLRHLCVPLPEVFGASGVALTH
jgi:hypothetical protein